MMLLCKPLLNGLRVNVAAVARISWFPFVSRFCCVIGLVLVFGLRGSAQYTFQFPNTMGLGSVDPAQDGGLIVLHSYSSALGFTKYDSLGNNQYSYSYPGTGLTRTASRFGKIFAGVNGSHNYFDIAKIDVATGAMQLKQRITGPLTPFSYFLGAPGNFYPTQDSGVIIHLPALACREVSGCDVCHMKLDKNLNILYFSSQLEFLMGDPFNLGMVENVDGSVTMATAISVPGYGPSTFLSRFNGTTGQHINTFGFAGVNVGYITTEVTRAGNQTLVTVHDGSNAGVVALQYDLSAINWWKQFSGVGSAIYSGGFYPGPGGHLYGRLGNYMVSLTSSGQMRWSATADGGVRIYPKFQMGQGRMANPYIVNTFPYKIAVTDSMGLGFCSSSMVTLTSTTPAYQTVSNPYIAQVATPFVASALATTASSSVTRTETKICLTTCNFTGSFNSTQNGLSFNFTAMPPGLVSYQWNFGDGGTSTQSNPSHTYAVAGTYNVCLIATSSCMSDTICQTVTATCSPANSGFSTSINALNASFGNSSTGQSPLTYQWTFGDGGTSTQANPTYSYASPGYYTACLIATNACGTDTTCQVLNMGCGNTVAAFSSVSNLYVATFTNGSSGQGNLSYAWDFGDGNTSTQANPVHTYSNTGTYNTCLLVSTPCGTDTTCQSITISCPAPNAQFSQTSTLLQAQFTNGSTSPGGTSYHWDFGDGGTSTAANPSHVYASAGTYTVCLIVNSTCGADTTCQQLIVSCPLPIAAFSSTTNQLTASFSNSSVLPSGSVVAWDFGDGSTSGTQNPVHSYAQPGTYTVCLFISAPCGSDTLCDTVTVTCPPLAAAMGYVGSFPTIQFTDLTAGSPTSWLWNFGDGGMSSSQNPAHAYANPGNYTVCLISSDSCSSDTNCQSVDVLVGVHAASVTGFDVYPLPAKDLAWVHLNAGSAPVKLRVSAMDGRTVMETVCSEQLVLLDVGDWTQGMYLVEVVADGWRATKRLVVQH